MWSPAYLTHVVTRISSWKLCPTGWGWISQTDSAGLSPKAQKILIAGPRRAASRLIKTWSWSPWTLWTWSPWQTQGVGVRGQTADDPPPGSGGLRNPYHMRMKTWRSENFGSRGPQSSRGKGQERAVTTTAISGFAVWDRGLHLRGCATGQPGRPGKPWCGLSLSENWLRVAWRLHRSPVAQGAKLVSWRRVLLRGSGDDLTPG